MFIYLSEFPFGELKRRRRDEAAGWLWVPWDALPSSGIAQPRFKEIIARETRPWESRDFANFVEICLKRTS